ncbi:MAG: hypothetical protein ACK56F_05900 [bacterium]
MRSKQLSNQPTDVLSGTAQVGASFPANTEKAHFSNEQQKYLQVPVLLPPEPMTIPREERSSRLRDRSTQGTTPQPR